MSLAASIANIPMPSRIARLPVCPRRKVPIPWFVTREPQLDFRVVRPDGVRDAVARKICWICGEPLGRMLCFVVGPLSAVSYVSGEPPSHADCGRYALRACPFLVNPRARRNEKDMLEEVVPAPGDHQPGNPGLGLAWITRSFRTFPAPGDGRPLFHMGPPEGIEWFREARGATYEEVRDAMAGALGRTLQDIQGKDAPPGWKARATQDALAAVASLRPWLPVPGAATLEAMVQRVAAADHRRGVVPPDEGGADAE